MQTLLVLSLLLFSICGRCVWGGLPDGYLLGVKVVSTQDSDHISLFRVDLDGTITEFWNVFLHGSEMLTADNLFAVNRESWLVYLGSVNQALALDLKTGAVKDKISLQPLNVQFWSYDYIVLGTRPYMVCVVAMGGGLGAV